MSGFGWKSNHLYSKKGFGQNNIPMESSDQNSLRQSESNNSKDTEHKNDKSKRLYTS